MLLIVINVVFTAIAGFLAWIYYKINQGLQFMLVIATSLLCHLIILEMKGTYQLVFSACCAIIFGILLNKKIDGIKAEYKKKRLEEAEKTYKKYLAQNSQRRKF